MRCLMEMVMTKYVEVKIRVVAFTQNIDNQRHGLETQAKFLMLLTPRP